jgi:hypothetical protein
VTTSTLLCALLASGLAVMLARENRIRRAFQDLVARLLDRLKAPASFQAGYQAGHRHKRGPHSHTPRNRL